MTIDVRSDRVRAVAEPLLPTVIGVRSLRKLYHCLNTQQRYDSATAFPRYQLPTARDS